MKTEEKNQTVKKEERERERETDRQTDRQTENTFLKRKRKNY